MEQTYTKRQFLEAPDRWQYVAVFQGQVVAMGVATYDEAGKMAEAAIAAARATGPVPETKTIEIWTMDTGLDETTYHVVLTEDQVEQVRQRLYKYMALGWRCHYRNFEPMTFEAFLKQFPDTETEKTA